MKAATAKQKLINSCLKYISEGDLTVHQFNDALKKVRAAAFADVKRQQRKAPQVFTTGELAAFLGAIDNAADELAFKLLFHTATRIDEFRNIRVRHLDLATGKLEVPAGKGNKRRYIPIPENLLLPLKQFTSNRREFLFENGMGNPYTRRSWQLKMKTYAEKAGFTGETLDKTTPHILRHTRATQWLDNGLNLREVQHLLGHSSISTTEIYTHISLARITDKINKMGDK